MKSLLRFCSKSFGSLLEISPTNNVFSKTFNSEFQDTEVRFTDQNSQPLEIEDRINLNNKYGQKLLDSAKKYTADALKTAAKRVIQKVAEGTGDLSGNKIADKITSFSKKSTKELQNDKTEVDKSSLKNAPKKKDTYFLKKGNKLLMN